MAAIWGNDKRTDVLVATFTFCKVAWLEKKNKRLFHLSGGGSLYCTFPQIGFHASFLRQKKLTLTFHTIYSRGRLFAPQPGYPSKSSSLFEWFYHRHRVNTFQGTFSYCTNCRKRTRKRKERRQLVEVVIRTIESIHRYM